VLGDYRDLFVTIATAAATLTGLLFVAMSVAETHTTAHPPLVREFRAAASLLAFINAFTVSLFGLVPGNDIGYPAIVLGVSGVAFTAAGVRTTLVLHNARRRQRPQVILFAVLLITFGVELAYGIALVVDRHSTGALDIIGDVLIVSLLIGIARAWELVGNWDTGLVSSIALISGHRDRLQGLIDEKSPTAGPAAGPDADGH